MKSFTLLLIILLTSSLSGLADPLPEQPPTISTISPTSLHLTWNGKNGRTYFIQRTADLTSWKYLPVIKSGTGAPLGYDFPTTANKLFFRLQYTDSATNNPLTDDFDGDGISNWDEIRLGGTDTNPLAEDSDGNGIRDDGLVYIAKNNPDNAGLPASLDDSELIGKWDMEETQGNVIEDSSGNGWFWITFL